VLSIVPLGKMEVPLRQFSSTLNEMIVTLVGLIYLPSNAYISYLKASFKIT